MEMNPILKTMILKAYSKSASITSALEVVRPMFPETTEAMVIEVVNDKVAATVRLTETEKPKKEVNKSSARVMQTDAYSALIAVQSKLVKFEDEFVKNKSVPEGLANALREICKETFTAIKEIG